MVPCMAVLVCTNNALSNGALYAASPYNAFVFNNFTSSNDDTQGGLAAGGNIGITGYSVASNITAAEAASWFPDGFTLIAGGSLNVSNGALYEGNAYGHTAGLSSFTLNAGTLTIGGTSAIDFSQAAAQLESLSAALAGMKTTAGDTCSLLYSVVTCTANANNLNIIDVSAAQAAMFSGNSIDLVSTAANATLAINVAGASDAIGGAGFAAFGNGGTVLFNYYQATSLALGSSSFTTSLLAPDATVTATSGEFHGTLIADDFSGSIEFHDDNPFTGSFSGIAPEPISLLLTASGLIALWLLLRRRAAVRDTGRASRIATAPDHSTVRRLTSSRLASLCRIGHNVGFRP
jgi:choice-of-anchor A domain-containing protein